MLAGKSNRPNDKTEIQMALVDARDFLVQRSACHPLVIGEWLGGLDGAMPCLFQQHGLRLDGVRRKLVLAPLTAIGVGHFDF